MTRNHPPVAQRMARIAPFHVMGLLARARELEARGRDVVHMEIGEPDFPTPAPVVQAALAAAGDGDVHYTPAMGLPELRQAVSGWYRRRYGVEVPASRIVVTPGASGALLLACGVTVDPGARMLMADPGYPCNRHFVRFCEGEAAGIAVGPESGYQLDAEQVARGWTARTTGVLLASPSNPTGTLVPEPRLRAIFEEVRSRGGVLIVDEIYHGLTYGGEARTALAIADEIFVVNSFSKYFGMTGWRLGWLVAPERYLPEVDKLAQNLFISASTVAQRAALAAFTPETLAILEERRGEFRRRRDFLVSALRELGFGVPLMPEGAFYVYADCSRITADSDCFARDLLEQAGVAVTPGLDFGQNRPERHVRFAYTTSLERLAEGMERLRDFLGRM